MDYSDLDDARRKHLELVQAVISRLAGNSFVIKGWTITLFIALMGFALGGNRSSLAALAGATSLVMWVLDAYFLQSERIFRAFYAAILRDEHEGWRPDAFAMDATSPTSLEALTMSRNWEDLREVMGSATLRLLYGPLASAAVGAAILLAV